MDKTVGVPIKLGEDIANQTKLTFARILVCENVAISLPSFWYESKKGELI